MAGGRKKAGLREVGALSLLLGGGKGFGPGLRIGDIIERNQYFSAVREINDLAGAGKQGARPETWQIDLNLMVLDRGARIDRGQEIRPRCFLENPVLAVCQRSFPASDRKL